MFLRVCSHSASGGTKEVAPLSSPIFLVDMGKGVVKGAGMIMQFLPREEYPGIMTILFFSLFTSAFSPYLVKCS